MNDLMIDLETLSTSHDAHILSIGAVYFDIQTGEIGNQFQAHIKFADGYAKGDISLETIAWWLGQSKSAQDSLLSANAEYQSVALNKLEHFIKPDINLWANGSSFDLVILRSAFDRECMQIPWSYWQERDCRTIVSLARTLTDVDPKKEIEFHGIQHTALADAYHQAQYVSKAYQLIRDRNS